MTSSHARCFRLVACAAALFAASAAHAAVSARINRVGLFAGAPPWARNGVMTFAEVDLRNPGPQPFEGTLRLTQLDRDGDVVVSVLPVAVAPDGEWESKEIYFIPNFADNDGRITIKLYNTDDEIVEFLNDVGAPVRSLASEPIYGEPLADDLLILSIASGGRSSHASYLELKNQYLDIEEPVTGRAVRGLASRELPRKSQGLDAVDAIVWEDADPSELQPEQCRALIGWVQQGGRLMLTVSSNWQKLEASPLAEILPLTIDGVDDVSAVPGMADLVIVRSTYDELEDTYQRNPVTRCRMRPRAGAIPIPTKSKKNEPIAYRAFVGRGMVTVLGARLRDLLPEPDVDDFDGSDDAKERRKDFAKTVERVVGNNLLALPSPRNAAGSNWMPEQRRDLFGSLTRTIGFSAVTTAFLFFAIAFAGAYTFVATLGSYIYLKRKGWAAHCWTAFTAISIVGGVIGLGMVWALRGFSTKVWQTSIVDARAGENYGHATCLFGVKTKDHTRLDLRLPVGFRDAPSGEGPLFALPKPIEVDLAGDSSFVATDTYALAQAGTLIDDVPVRATLKEFEGRWHGDLGGTLDARLILDTSTRQFTKDSYLRNNLGVKLDDCYLFEGDQEIAGEGGSPIGIRCHPVGPLLDSGPESSLDGEAFFNTLYEKKNEKNDDGTSVYRTGQELFLTNYLTVWRGRSLFGGLGQTRPRPNTRTIDEHSPFLLLSLYNLIEPLPGNQTWDMRRTFGRRLDCSHWITKNTAVLVGFSRDKPPAVLEIDRANEIPEKSLTMYRFLIPVERR